MSDTTLTHPCWTCDTMLPDGIYTCAVCEIEMNNEEPPQDYEKEASDERPITNDVRPRQSAQ